MSGGKGKRGPSAPLATTSDEDEPADNVSSADISMPSAVARPVSPSLGSCPQGAVVIGAPATPPPTPTAPGATAASPTPTPSASPSEHDYALLDHDYDNVSSPGNSSTASGPTYVRQPGFTQHAHEVTATPTVAAVVPQVPTPPTSPRSLVSRPKIKKKKTTLLAVKDGLKKREPIPPKTRPKREPLPMRLRALPQSFWQQPNVPHTVSPGTAYPILPPLCTKDGEEVEDDMRPVTPPEEREEREERERKEKIVKPPRLPERKIIVANTDLLFKLFEGLEKEKKSKASSSTIKRGRPKKVVPSSNKTFVSGEDPYLVDCVSEKLFPQLSLENCGKIQTLSNPSYGSNSTMLQVVTIHEGDKCINLPSLSIEQNYSQMLSELVMHI